MPDPFDGNGEPIDQLIGKGPRNPRGGGGGTAPGPGGGFGSFAGFGGQGLPSMPEGSGMDLPLGLMRRKPYQHPEEALAILQQTGYRDGGQVSGGPSGRDTVPAMLDNGEGVLNRGAMKMTLADLLHIINLIGMHGENLPEGQDDRQHLALGGIAGLRQPASPWGGNILQQPSGPAPQYDPQGNVSHFDPNNPWADNQRNDAIGQLGRLTSAYGRQGFYGPGGNQAGYDAARESAMTDVNAFGDKAYNAANVNGMDPSQAAASRLQALASAGRGVGEGLARYRTDAMSRNDDFAKWLLSQQTGQGIDWASRQQQYELDKRRTQDSQKAPSFGQAATQIGAAAVGGYVGGGIGRSQPSPTYDPNTYGPRP